jgi:hypothetical protein
VAVHGLGGDAINSWTHQKSKAFWLRDFLPHQIPDARIMTFGYNADIAFGQSTAEIVDHAKSLLASLVDRERSRMCGRYIEGESEEIIDVGLGDPPSSDIHRPLSGGHCGETSMLTSKGPTKAVGD